MTYPRLISAIAFSALLAACGEGGAPQEGEVSGEVLEGTISDEMLPLDQVRSEAPFADPTGTGSGPAPAADESAEPTGEADAEPPAEQAPESEVPTEAED